MHRDHLFKTRGESPEMSPKWCVDPNGPLRGKYWRLHGIYGATRRDHGTGFRFLHCRHISTNWDYARDFLQERALEPDPEAKLLSEVFSDAVEP